MSSYHAEKVTFQSVGRLTIHQLIDPTNQASRSAGRPIRLTQEGEKDGQVRKSKSMNTSISPFLTNFVFTLSHSQHLSAAHTHTHTHTQDNTYTFSNRSINRTDKQNNTYNQSVSQRVRQPYTLKINHQQSVQAYILKLNNSIQVKLKCTPRMSLNSSTPLSSSPLSLSITTTEMQPHTHINFSFTHASTRPTHNPTHMHTQSYTHTHTLPSQHKHTHIHSHNFSHNSS